MYEYKPPVSAILKVGQRGTVVIPAEIRRALGIECGSTILMLVDDEDLVVTRVPDDPIDRLEWALNQAYEGLSGEEVEERLKGLHAEWSR